MQFIFFSVLVLLFSGVSSFSLVPRQQGAPNCALTCLATTSPGSCGTNNTCLCHDETFLEAELACVKKSCTSTSDFQAAEQFAIALCKEFGVDLTTDTSLLPQGTAGADASGSGSTPATTTNSPTPSATSPSGSSPSPSPTQTSGATSLNVRAAAGLLLTIAGIAMIL